MNFYKIDLLNKFYTVSYSDHRYEMYEWTNWIGILIPSREVNMSQSCLITGWLS